MGRRRRDIATKESEMYDMEIDVVVDVVENESENLTVPSNQNLGKKQRIWCVWFQVQQDTSCPGNS